MYDILIACKQESYIIMQDMTRVIQISKSSRTKTPALPKMHKFNR